MALSRFQKIFYSLAGLGGLWAIFIATLIHPSVQRFALYAHRIHTLWLHDIDKPQVFGFAERQVTPFRIRTDDGETLYAWHVLPLGLYAEHERAIMSEPAVDPSSDRIGKVALGLLREKDCRLVINFHGNAGHIAQGWRGAAYKALSAADSTSRTHILTFDYRGFGKSSGFPSEEGLIADGRAILRWATDVAGIDPSRIVLLGHSLGSAVAAAVARDAVVANGDGVTEASSFPFAGLMLLSGFSDVPTLMKTFAIGGFLPVLSPLRGYPFLQGVLADLVVDKWNTSERLTELSGARGLRLHIMHARNDLDIGWQHSDLLFDAASSKLAVADVKEFTTDETWEKTVEAHERSSSNGDLEGYWVRRTLLPNGGHNRVISYGQVAVAIRRLFEMQEAKA